MRCIEYQSPKTENQRRHGLLVAEGRKWIKVLLIDYPVKVRRVPKDELRYIEDYDYKVSKMQKVLKRMVKRHLGKLTEAPRNVRTALRG